MRNEMKPKIFFYKMRLCRYLHFSLLTSHFSLNKRLPGQNRPILKSEG